MVLVVFLQYVGPGVSIMQVRGLLLCALCRVCAARYISVTCSSTQNPSAIAAHATGSRRCAMKAT